MRVGTCTTLENFKRGPDYIVSGIGRDSGRKHVTKKEDRYAEPPTRRSVEVGRDGETRCPVTEIPSSSESGGRVGVVTTTEQSLLLVHLASGEGSP